MKIWLDLDEVLCSSMKPWLERCKEELGFYLPFEKVKNYALWELSVVKHTKEEIVKVFAQMIEDDYKNWHNILFPIDGAVDWVKRLANSGWEIVVITSRPSILKNATMSWIEKYFPGMIKDVIFTNKDVENLRLWNKGEILKSLWLDVFVEDNFENAQKAINFVKKIFLFKKPWNIEFLKNVEIGNLYVVNNWAELIVKLWFLEK